MRQRKLVPAIVCAVVAAAIVTGLIVSGSPQRQRELRMDQQRSSELRQLSTALSRYYRDRASLPAELDAAVDGRILTSVPRDPLTDQSYDYERTGPASYRLCAEFAQAAESLPEDDFWAHASGRQCFEFDYADIRLD